MVTSTPAVVILPGLLIWEYASRYFFSQDWVEKHNLFFGKDLEIVSCSCRVESSTVRKNCFHCKLFSPDESFRNNNTARGREDILLPMWGEGGHMSELVLPKATTQKLI
jgi:hypothetical protein